MSSTTSPTTLFPLDDVDPGSARHAVVADVDLVVIRPQDTPDQVVALFGRCQHRGALLADGDVRGGQLTCGLHGSTYRIDTGQNIFHPGADLARFTAGVTDGQIWVDEAEVTAWREKHPQRIRRSAYQGAYADPKGTDDEPARNAIHRLAASGLDRVGHHGPMAAMGVPGPSLPRWDDLQFVTAQLATAPLLDDEPVATDVVIGPAAARPLRLQIPLFVSDMSFGALSAEAKTALATGAELAGTGICSGEGGMLQAEKDANSRYFYELASARFGFAWEKVADCQALHFKGGQAAKTGTGGHLPGHKVTEEIAAVRGLEPGQAAVSPARFPDLVSVEDFREVAAKAREVTGGVPIGFKLSAQHIEADLDAALAIGVDYVILDGRGGGTGAAPVLFRDHISVPTIPALARARAHLDRIGADHVSLVITGGLRTAPDFAKALALGADAVAVSNAAMQAIGCLAMRACETGRCPVGIATQDPALRSRLPVDEAAERLARFLTSSVELMSVLARACGHRSLGDFTRDDLVTWKQEMAALSGVRFAGVGALDRP
ncbi:glutamate synthase-related protein [Nocardioides limicola]|uniref:glutamate synthase-related protein n=1 Tax=Nocardioides limicola TaxID=2803368 RepID=UPI00193B442F|nr:glutamate synthase-related protein [Nocardioides sp. DJM-14]